MVTLNTLGHFVASEHRLKAIANCIVAAHVHPFVTTGYPSCNGCFQQDNTPRHKAQNHLKLLFQAGEYDIKFSVLKWPPQAADLNLTQQLWDVVKREIHIIDAIMSIWIQIYAQMFPETY